MAKHPTGMTGQGYPNTNQTENRIPPQPKSVSATAIVGLVLGVLAIASCWIPIINNISFFAGLIGLVFSIIGTVGTVRGKSNGKGIAIAGLILNILSMVLVFWLQSTWSAELSSSSSSEGQSSSTQQATTTTASSDYEVTIDDCTLTKDYAGDPVIVIAYTWTNNSDDAESFDFAFTADAYQNGVGLESAYILANEDEFDLELLSTKLKPGASQTIYKAYLLQDETTDVDVEVIDFGLFDDTVLAEKTFSIS